MSDSASRQRPAGWTGSPDVAKDWRGYFDGLADHSPLYREQSALYVESLIREVGLSGDQRVLDFGCGFGFVSALLAPRVAELWLWDPSPNMRSVAERSTADLPNVRFCEPEPTRSSPLPFTWEGSAFDLILVNSVAQYMAPEELWGWLARWRAMLAPAGRLVLSDLIAPDHGGLADLSDLLRLGARHGSPLRAAREALGGLSHYWRTSRAVPLTRVGRDELTRRAADAGLATTVLPRNLTHFRGRWTAVLSVRSRPE